MARFSSSFSVAALCGLVALAASRPVDRLAAQTNGSPACTAYDSRELGKRGLAGGE